MCANSLAHKLKIKPHADRIRAALHLLPCPGISEIKFAPGDWRPTARFYCYQGERTGKVFSVRNHRDKTFILRVA